MNRMYLFVVVFMLCIGCQQEKETTLTKNHESSYLDYSDKDDALSGGVKMIPIQTSAGEFNVWTKRVGNNPKMKVLLLHGGPGATHEYFECFDSFFPKAEIEYYYYDQLESFYSDQPNDSTLWSVDRYVDEVEQVRKSLNLDKDNFYLYGSSWGGILTMEYALKYQDNLKGIIISNMMASIPEYINYAETFLGPQMDPEVLKEIKALEAAGEFTNPRYNELVLNNYYPEHVLRMPLEEWPNPVSRAFANINYDLYLTMQGPSEFGVVGDAKLKDWDITDQLSKIEVPTLSIGGAYDTMDPIHMEWIASEVQNGRYLHCPKGSHLAMYDDQETYFEGLITFIKDVDNGTFK
ncbi:proline iminopeptidase-family hydrolase [Psychroserpens sp.]|uniref:proline iminopeptidase-family hydrolase n=1 Tax=Psychroserpens sp. TaxID=2020870 RepID=UPI001B2C35C8|nr:proline iminopeptidase-family hydrolase [Psychroserpens sp.]MBO6606497.1 proline iminopeptidase-family hydrolase [Psychroserpens sp.]MBO6630409.1 proline iminopeptidase-family hydrolase [Psychroserpens sp.]MBO6653201.1 proline iminopeptidase-family hydrolase [Psychroserpens sp.]MBO6680771.1 proline iminopeptidase-family hydrolase [Psychroserpens sp.]MBO6750271.1 proline iminopeptidase-family hydrolase [Psychroserpens sp.]